MRQILPSHGTDFFIPRDEFLRLVRWILSSRGMDSDAKSCVFTGYRWYLHRIYAVRERDIDGENTGYRWCAHRIYPVRAPSISRAAKNQESEGCKYCSQGTQALHLRNTSNTFTEHKQYISEPQVFCASHASVSQKAL